MAFAHPRQKMDCDSNRRDGDGQRWCIGLENASIVENCFLDAKPLGTPGGFFIARLKNNSVENQCVVKIMEKTFLFLLTIRKVDVSLGYQLTGASTHPAAYSKFGGDAGLAAFLISRYELSRILQKISMFCF